MRQPSLGPDKSPSRPVDSGAVNYIEGLFSDNANANKPLEVSPLPTIAEDPEAAQADNPVRPSSQKIFNPEEDAQIEEAAPDPPSNIVMGGLDDVITDSKRALEQLGEIESHYQKLNEELNLTNVELKHLVYDAERDESKVWADPDLIELNRANISRQRNQQPGHYSYSYRQNLYQNNVISYINSFYDSKYEDLEKRRKSTEKEYEHSLMTKYQLGP